MTTSSIEDFIRVLPKAELHLHIEGTFEPELMFEIAQRNSLPIKYKSIEEVRRAYNFNNLQDFLDIYYESAAVLTTERDFYDLTWAYLTKAHLQNVVHAEIFFDPQTHTDRGISFHTVVTGIHNALRDGQDKLGISSKLILCFLRHLNEDAAMKTLEAALKYKKWIAAVGLDSGEVGNPPAKFKQVFERALQEGFLTVAHAGEEGPADYVWEALNTLHVSRIDHGNHSIDDTDLLDELSERNIPLTLCPLSNLKLKVVNDLSQHQLRTFMDKKILVTINSDDPAYFGGYIQENYLAIASALKLSKEEIITIVKNSFNASFLDVETKQRLIYKVDSVVSDSL